MAATQTDEDHPIRCGSCGYSWEYSGELWQATCPRCNNKTQTPLHPDNQ